MFRAWPCELRWECDRVSFAGSVTVGVDWILIHVCVSGLAPTVQTRNVVTELGAVTCDSCVQSGCDYHREQSCTTLIQLRVLAAWLAHMHGTLLVVAWHTHVDRRDTTRADAQCARDV